MDSDFIPFLKKWYNENKEYERVSTWAKKKKNVDLHYNLFEKDIIIIPYNVNNNHWILWLIINPSAIVDQKSG